MLHSLEQSIGVGCIGLFVLVGCASMGLFRSSIERQSELLHRRIVAQLPIADQALVEKHHGSIQ